MKKNLMSLLFVVIALSFLVPAVYAADPAVPAELAPVAGDVADEETEFSFGTVKSIGNNQLVVNEYDYESNADVDVTYQVPAETEFENVASLTEIAVGDSVDIDYLVDGANKKAVAITVEKPLTEEEEAALEAIPAEAETKE